MAPPAGARPGLGFGSAVASPRSPPHQRSPMLAETGGAAWARPRSCRDRACLDPVSRQGVASTPEVAPWCAPVRTAAAIGVSPGPQRAGPPHHPIPGKGRARRQLWADGPRLSPGVRNGAVAGAPRYQLLVSWGRCGARCLAGERHTEALRTRRRGSTCPGASIRALTASTGRRGLCRRGRSHGAKQVAAHLLQACASDVGATVCRASMPAGSVGTDRCRAGSARTGQSWRSAFRQESPQGPPSRR